MINVKLPNGGTAQFPDGMPAAEIQAVLARQFPTQQAAASGPATPPVGLKPGTREYADWAAQAARAGQALPQVSNTTIANMSANPDGSLAKGNIGVPIAQGMTFGWGDEIASAALATGDALQGKDFGQSFGSNMDHYQTLLDYERETNPVGSIAGEIGGAMLPSVLSFGAGPVLQGSTMLGRSAIGAGTGLAQGLLYGAGATEGNVGDRAKGALVSGAVGGVVGGALPMVSNAIGQAIQKGQQSQVLTAAARAAPAADELKSAASQVFEQATGGTPLAISDNAFFRFLGGVKAQADKLRINSNLDQKSVGLLEMMMQTADDVSRGGTVVDMKDLHIIRQAAQKVAMSAEGRDAAFANTIIRQFDDFVQTLKPADILGGADPSQAANALMKGISGWSRANKVGMVEEAIRVGQMAASGPEKGIRNALRALARNPETWRRFSTAEQQAIMDVVNGTGTSNLLKLIGTFGFGGNVATSGVGGAAGIALGGMAGGPVGMVAGPIIGGLAKAGSERMTDNLAQRALGAVATDGLKIIPKVNPNQPTMLEQILRRTALPATAPLVQAR